MTSELQVQARDGGVTTLPEEVVEAFRAKLRGRVLLAGDGDYEEARRLWNGMIDRRPGMIVRCAGTADVVSSVNLARDHDLLLAVRGGGGNFGVVTSFDFRLHPVGPEVMLLAASYPMSVAEEGLRAFREYMSTAPEDLFALAVLWRCPEGPLFPEEMHGQNVLVFVGVYSGPLEVGEQVIQSLRDFGTPIADLSGPVSWLEAQSFFDPDYPDGLLYYWKSIYLDRLSDEVVKVLVAQARERPSPGSSVDVWYLGGAYSRVGPDETAVGRRDAEVMIGLEGNWSAPEESEANIRWTREAYARLRPFSSGGSYVNFGGYADESREVVRDVYARNLDRLAAIKQRYDPANLFRVNHNIPPTDQT